MKENVELINNLGNVYFYVDNAKIHYAAIITPILSRLNIFYGPPYSPFIDMAEEAFALSKHYVRNSFNKSREELIVSIFNSLTFLT